MPRGPRCLNSWIVRHMLIFGSVLLVGVVLKLCGGRGAPAPHHHPPASGDLHRQQGGDPPAGLLVPQTGPVVC